MRNPTRVGSSLRSGAGFGLIEALAALAIVSIAVLGVAGTSLRVGEQDRTSTVATDHAIVAGQVMERVRAAGYAAAASGTDTVAYGGRTYLVSRLVTPAGPRLKAVRLVVRDRVGASRPFETRLLLDRPLPGGS